MRVRLFQAYPPDNEWPEAQITVSHEDSNGIDIPIIVTRDGDVLTLTIYTPEGQRPWQLPAKEVVEALRQGVDWLQSLQA